MVHWFAKALSGSNSGCGHPSLWCTLAGRWGAKPLLSTYYVSVLAWHITVIIFSLSAHKHSVRERLIIASLEISKLESGEVKPLVQENGRTGTVPGSACL